MGYKSRGNFAQNWCFKKCLNRDKKCDVCVTIQGKPTHLKPPQEIK
jgi:hypothetical protein